jgi:aminopeptidase
MNKYLEKHAHVLLNYSVELKKGEKLAIIGQLATYPLIKEIYRQAIDLGAFPECHFLEEELQEIVLRAGNEEQIKYLPESLQKSYKIADVLLTIWGSANTRIFSNIEPVKMKIYSQGRKPIVDLLFSRLTKGEARWCGTLSPTQATAQEASMSLSEYEKFAYTAGHLNDTNPISSWKKIDREQEKICKFLNKKERLRIISQDTDLTVSVKGRKWINCSGKENFPDGEVFTSPVEDSAEGHIRFSFPAIHDGREVEDIRLILSKGKVVKASALKGEIFLKEMLKSDEGASFLGEVAIGTNYNISQFTKNILFDEKIGGTTHVALGRSLPEAGGKNISVIHWDMLCDMKNGGKIFADNQLIYQDGKFTIEF